MPNKRDLTGQRFGRLTVLSEGPRTASNRITWHCKCECGNEVDVQSSSLTKKNYPTRSCGCLQRDRTREANRLKEDLSGKVFGYLTVLERIENNSYWLCQCKCGNIIEVSTNHLKSGHTQSCGCYQKEQASKFKAINLIGQKFGLLTVESLNVEKSTSEIKYWNCKCECGNSIIIPTGRLQSNNTKSCGCLKISHGELKIKQLLEEYNISFEMEKTFPNCKNPKTNKQLRFDFYVNNLYLIEFDGKQHFNSEDGWDESLEDIQYRDNIKNKWCIENNIPLIRIKYDRLEDLTINDLLPN